MSSKQKALCLLIVGVLGILSAGVASAGIFGELHLGLGGTFPQGTFARYADPGFIVDLRATIHIPAVEFIVGWLDFNYIMFARETVETNGSIISDTGMRITFPVNEKYAEDLFNGHVGIQLANPTQHGMFRPRAGIGLGFYNFVTDLTWEADLPDTTIEIATQDLDDQLRMGWRGIIGADFFFTPQFGASADFIYDHVFNVERIEGTEVVDRTSRFLGFTIGFVYMFQAE
jgi:hypothetical protein